MSLLSGRRVTDLELTIPPAGGWLGTGHLDSGAALATGPATLVLGDLSMIGTVLRGGVDSPDRPAFVVAGGAGWSTLLQGPGGAYASPSGVRLRTVLADLARAAGEAYDVPADVSIGAAYGWDAGTPVDAVLAELVTRGALGPWRAQPNGRTSFAPWPALPAADTHGHVVDRRLARGLREVALTTSVAAWLPGATVQGVTIARTTLNETQDELRALVWDS